MHDLSFMGVCEPESFRGRLYGVPDDHEEARREFVLGLYFKGVIDCPAYDPWIFALDERGWLQFRFEPNPDGPGRLKRWFLAERGRAALRHLVEGE